MARFDLEMVLDQIKAILLRDFDAQVDKIQAEKKDELELPYVDQDMSYFVQFWTEGILNACPAILLGAERIEADSTGPSTQEKFHISIEILIQDNMQDALAYKRILRYSRALKEVIEKNWDQTRFGKLKVETVAPVAFKLNMNSTDEYKLGGISFYTSIM